MMQKISSLAMNRNIMGKRLKIIKFDSSFILIATLPAMQFSTGGKRVYGGLKD
jgi:hypothetical protein